MCKHTILENPKQLESFGGRPANVPMSLDLKRQLVAQLVESSRLLRNYIDHRAKGRGTTRAQWIVLFRLRQQEGLSQVDLADVLELQPISLVRLLDRLVEHGLLERRHDPKDRRANRLFLTATGRQLVDDLDSLRDSIADRRVAGRCHGMRSRPASRRSATSRSGSRALPSPATSPPSSGPRGCQRGGRRPYHGLRATAGACDG